MKQYIEIHSCKYYPYLDSNKSKILIFSSKTFPFLFDFDTSNFKVVLLAQSTL